MTEQELVQWLEDLAKRADHVPANQSLWRQIGPATAWLTEAETALVAAFPSAHWRRTCSTCASGTG